MTGQLPGHIKRKYENLLNPKEGKTRRKRQGTHRTCRQDEAEGGLVHGPAKCAAPRLPRSHGQAVRPEPRPWSRQRAAGREPDGHSAGRVSLGRPLGQHGSPPEPRCSPSGNKGTCPHGFCMWTPKAALLTTRGSWKQRPRPAAAEREHRGGVLSDAAPRSALMRFGETGHPGCAGQAGRGRGSLFADGAALCLRGGCKHQPTPGHVITARLQG